MTPHELLADGRLAEALAAQEATVGDRPDDAPARLFLVELLAFAGRLLDARAHLDDIASADPAWPASRRQFRQLLRAERRRSEGVRRPVIVPDPPAPHARGRWRAAKALRDGQPEDATRWTDRADAATPEVRGFLDGQEFDGLRDADDRFASVLEAFAGGDYLWVPWEAVRRVALRPAKYALDRLFRPAQLRFKDGAELAVHLPLVYPRSYEADEAFALGLETDRVCPDGGPIRCVGGKELLVGDAEVPLADCRMIEIK